MATPLLIFPFNGNALEALDALGSEFELIGFIDDTPEKQGPNGHGYGVFSRAALRLWPTVKVLAVPGSAASFAQRRSLIESLDIEPDRYATVIHPAARVSRFAKVGHNTLVLAGVVLTSNAVIGDHVCVLPNSVVHHHSEIGSWSLIGSNVTVAGHTRVGENCYIGSGSSIKDGLTLGERTLVGLGSTVIRDTPPDSRVAGCPARQL